MRIFGEDNRFFRLSLCNCLLGAIQMRLLLEIWLLLQLWILRIYIHGFEHLVSQSHGDMRDH